MEKVNLSYVLGFIICLSVPSFSQNENSKWYFGANAGLDFMTSPPTVINNGNITGPEACASISDQNGNLLFYTDGVQIWNAANNVMQGGAALLGHVSTTQCLIVKKPKSSSIYYVFTLAQLGNANGFNYYVVDMTLASGLGAVVGSANFVYGPTSEKITGVRHCNGVDIWVVTHDYNSNVFRSFLLTPSGFNTSAVTSTVGTVQSSSSLDNSVGQMKISPSGKKLGLAIQAAGIYELFDFNRATGIISNPITFNFGVYGTYGCEFSPDGTKFYGARYTTTTGVIYQWDVCASSSPTAIAASQYSFTTTSRGIGMQRAIDGKIYLVKYTQSGLSAINNPNLSGVNCNYTTTGVSTGTRTCMLGLPNFMTDIAKPQPTAFTHTLNPLQSCTTVSFSSIPITTVPVSCAATPDSYTSIKWLLGDPASGSLNTSTVQSPIHNYSGGGTFTVNLIFIGPCLSDTVTDVITIPTSSLTINATPSLKICKGNSTTLIASGATTYTWNNTINAFSITVTPSTTTTYSVVGTGTSNCSTKSEITVVVLNCTGLSENSLAPVRIFPNPAQNAVTISSLAEGLIFVYDAFGKLILKKEFFTGENKLNIENLTNGVYFIRCETTLGNGNFRFIKTD